MRIARLFVIFSILSASTSTPAAAVEITIACGAKGQEFTLCKEGALAWAKQTGNTVAFLITPGSSERLALYQQFLTAQDHSVDVLQIDVIWLGILHRHFLDLMPYVPEEILHS